MMRAPTRSMTLALGALAALLTTGLTRAAEAPDASPLLKTLQWRSIGPARGGRAATVAGVVGDRNTYYMGATGGGVWKTTDAGASWKNVSDGFFKTGSVGAIAVAPSDPNVVYVGMGETCVRGNFSQGDGVYRSLDAGKTWTRVGLVDSRQIGDITIDPQNPDVVFVAALGHVFGESAQRGVYKTTDGGATWRDVLSVDDKTGAVDLAMDPHNPRVLFAGLWQIRRTPWSLESGGPGSGLYRSTDAGETWQELTKGLPEGVKGKIGVAVSPAQRDLVYAIIEAKDGGVFRSMDGGDTWSRVSEDRSLRQRAWYYTHIEADPEDADTVYVLNVRFKKSVDGGKSWTNIRVPHGDNHHLWIDPADHARMIECNDGGANVTFDGGRTWSTQANQPTAQFYHVAVDNNFPYRVYGSQQDNSSASVSSRMNPRFDWRRDLYAVGGGESGYIAVDPEDPDIVYAGSYGGTLTRTDHGLGVSREIDVWPENPMGSGADTLTHRFQWTFPIVISPHDHNTVFVGGERVFRTRDGGASWEPISPDLTTNDKAKQRSSGGPITQDNTSVEYYCTVFTIAESPVKKGVIWAGSDDGLIHVTRDGGRSWEDVTPPDMGDWPLISMIEASPHDADTAYVAVNRYKMDDMAPYIYRTRDSGKTWDLVADGVGHSAFVRSVREDPVRAGLLYAATETGVYVSLNAGDSWEPLQLNLPVAPVTDLVVKGDDLVISTQGRSFWILGDLGVLRQLDPGASVEGAKLYTPGPAYRVRWDSVRVHFNLPDPAPAKASLVFRNAKGDEVRAFSLVPKPADEEKSEKKPEKEPKKNTVEVEPGMNKVVWNFRLDDPVKVPGAVAWPPHPHGPRVPPGQYTAELRLGDQTLRTEFEIRADPRVGTTQPGYDEQFALLVRINDALSAAHTAVNDIRAIRAQVNRAMKQAKEADQSSDALEKSSTGLLDALRAVEEEIIQTRSKSPQDPLNFPIKINDRIGALAYTVDGDYPPTEQASAVFESLRTRLDAQLDRLAQIKAEVVPEFNRLMERARVPAVVTPGAGQD